MSRRVALPVLVWSISASSAEDPPADRSVIELEQLTVTATKTEWLAEEAGYSVRRVDFRIDNLTDKAYRRHHSLVDLAGRNFKVSVSHRF